MNHTYKIEGMTCEGCYSKVKNTLENLDGVSKAIVNLNEGTAELEMSHHVSTEVMENALQKAGSKYHISEITHPSPKIPDETEDDTKKSFLETYKPLLLIIGFIAGIALLSQYKSSEFDLMLWMRHFMAGFFIVFAFFKMLNLSGFASSYAMYDVVAAKWRNWGYIYPFVELILGISYFVNYNPVFTNWATILILGVSSIGVIQSNLNKRKIKCACLGDVFNLPMSTVTIVEDLSMVVMAAFMILFNGIN